jgi:hypothetical protein|tara:strand:- start:184 stop:588 length:405 start_codon:yes stop_codon:yes gene_type:complete
MSDMKLDDLVTTYLTIRTERNTLKNQWEIRDSELKTDLDELERAMLVACNEINADSIRTGSGTIIKSLKETYTCGDWDNFKQFVVDNNALDLLQQRISQTNFKEFMSTRQEDGLPPGISTLREFAITVRKPTSK